MVAEISRKAARGLRYRASADPLRGRITGPFTSEWDVSGRCQEPLAVEVVSERGLRAPALRTHLEVRCRKCPVCRRERQSAWVKRMLTEMHASPRTWFVTLTLSPESHHRYRVCARKRIATRQLIRDRAYEATQLPQELIRQELLEVQKYLKRIRKGGTYTHEETGAVVKQPPSKVRYVIFVEHHKSGLPHYHALLHEVAGEPPMSRRWLQKQWGHGWGVWKLAATQNAYYIAKYASKEGTLGRIRASRMYGNSDLWSITDRKEPLG